MAYSGCRLLRSPALYLKGTAAIVLLFILAIVTSPPTGDRRGQSEEDILIRKLRHKADDALIFQRNHVLVRALYLDHKDTDVVVYNRVPKCASTSTRAVFADLAKGNDIKVFSSKIYAKEVLNSTDQVQFAKEVSHMRETYAKPLVFIRHVFFVDFEKLGFGQPVYINVIRDPLDRHISDYYFKRYNLRYMFPMADAKRKMTYDECVLGNHSECVSDTNRGYFRVIPYFCGQDPRCHHASHWALERAMHNVERFFPVVGTVEDIKGFLTILEVLLPHIFKDASTQYITQAKRYRKMAKTAKKDKVSDKVKQIMKSKMKYDYEFYEFVRQRFQKQWHELVAGSHDALGQ